MRICVFCGSNSGADAAYAAVARELAQALAARDVDLVFGGGRVGLMGVIADAMLAAGGHVIGVMPRALVARELAHRGIQDLRIVESMHERKALMAELSDGFVAMPGGFGTFEEICEAITWTQLGLHQKRCGLLNVAGFYDPLVRLFEEAASAGFIRRSNLEIVSVDSSPAGLLDALLRPLPPPEAKWIRDVTET